MIVSFAFIVAGIGLLMPSGQAVKAQAVGWNDIGSGCQAYYDGAEFTEIECGATPRWIDLFGDGCLYYWDGTTFTVEDCGEPELPAGWYDRYGDGCTYYWNGSTYTRISCAATGETLIYGTDGCAYYYVGATLTTRICEDSVYDYTTGEALVLGADGCYYWWDGAAAYVLDHCGEDEGRLVPEAPVLAPAGQAGGIAPAVPSLAPRGGGGRPLTLHVGGGWQAPGAAGGGGGGNQWLVRLVAGLAEALAAPRDRAVVRGWAELLRTPVGCRRPTAID